MKERIEIPKEVVASILVTSARTCCVCNEPDKEVQIHHIDEDPSNNDPSNLAALCFSCHNETQIKGGFGRKLDAVQVLKYKAEWEQRVRERKAKADEAMIARYLGAANSASLSTSAPERRDWIPNEERLTGFIKLLPVMKKDVYGRSYKKWDQGSTPSQVRGCRDCIDVFQQILVTLCGWYPPNHFGETGIEDFIDSYVAFSYRWHRGLEEPLGYGTGGTIVRVLVSDAVMHDIDDLIVSMVRSLLGNVDSDVDFLEWQSSWKSAEDRPEE
jgi:hypothetical protein